jgi:BirA family biotin operon repressor/biotin-[acetyl-CoA-carboxylase] ligase
MPVIFFRPLLAALNDQNWHSEPELCARLNLSAEQLAELITHIIRQGIDINITPQGYQLSRAIELLDPAIIEAEIAAELKQQVSQFEYFDTILSTNRYLLDNINIEQPGIRVCLAEQQTAGVGQHGRTWVSPYGCNMYLSIIWPYYHKTATELGTLSLSIGVAVVQALAAFGIDKQRLQLKWPNDIFADDRKLAGILTETRQQGAILNCVIGVGLNIAMPKAIDNITQPYIDIQSLLADGRVTRNKLIGLCIQHILQTCQTFDQHGFAAYLADWKQHDYLYQQPVKLLVGKQEISGVGAGVSPTGQLLIQLSDGEIKPFASGEASVRKA